jgi:two-component system phosphate regulon sensor histidine kinase PhoR
MTFLLGRLAALLLGLALGGLLGRWMDGFWPLLQGWGAWGGAALGVVLMSARDSWRGHRIMEWLRSGQSAGAPRSHDAWGELAYRIEKAQLQRDRLAADERRKLGEFLSAIEASPNGVLLLDGSDHIVWCNSVAAEHFGLDPERDRGQRVTNLVRSPAFVTYLQAPSPDEPIAVVNAQADLTLSVLLRPYGEGQKLVLTQDVTERLRAESMRRDFVANVSHEIRTPLTVLAGFVETLANLPLNQAERQRVLALMSQQTGRMQALVADLLTLAQLEGSPRPQADHWLSLLELLQQVETQTRGLSNGRHTLLFPEPNTLAGIQVAGHRGELLSAFSNLTSNAVRYTPEGGRIEVGCSLLSVGELEFQVSDSGPGIERQHLPRLTERFYRVDGSRSRETGGTGLGLSIVKHVLQRHGAHLDIESEPGKGSQFRILLPGMRVRRGETTRTQAPSMPV